MNYTKLAVCAVTAFMISLLTNNISFASSGYTTQQHNFIKASVAHYGGHGRYRYKHRGWVVYFPVNYDHPERRMIRAVYFPACRSCKHRSYHRARSCDCSSCVRYRSWRGTGYGPWRLYQ